MQLFLNRYLVSEDGFQPMLERRDGHRDRLDNTFINAALQDLDGESGPYVARVVTDAAGLMRAQQILGRSFERTGIDILSDGEVDQRQIPIVGTFSPQGSTTGGVKSDFYLALGTVGSQVAFHPISILLADRQHQAGVTAFRRSIIAALEAANISVSSVLSPEEATV